MFFHYKTADVLFTKCLSFIKKSFLYSLRLFSVPFSGSGSRSQQSRNQTIVFLNIIISCLLFIVLSLSLFSLFALRAFEAKSSYSKDKIFRIHVNTSLVDMAHQLEEADIIDNAWIFCFGVRWYKNAKILKAGEYKIPAYASMHDVMELFKRGHSIMKSITIPEGFTVQQALQRIEEHPDLSGEMPNMDILEGMLLADTQHFKVDTTRRSIIEKMLHSQKKVVEQIWAKRAKDLPIKNIQEFVTLASIVEKETSIPEERTLIASVLINRLRKGMRLQSDPTIIYGLFGGKGKPNDRAIFQEDIETRTPYNTYFIKGLPPTPIAIPGRESLEAVANPQETDFFYFVAQTEGRHAFSKTLAEHNKHVLRWRKIKEKKDASSLPSILDLKEKKALQ